MRNLRILVLTFILCLMIGAASSAGADGLENGSSNDWDVKLSNTDWGQISIEWFGPSADWDHPIWKKVIPGIKLGVKLKIGGSGDFDVDIKEPNLNSSVNLDTHIVRTATGIWKDNKGMYMKKFTPANILDYLRIPTLSGSIEGYFAAASTAPVRVKGHFNNVVTVTFSTTEGVKKEEDRKTTLTSVEPAKPGEDVVFFVGSDFLETVRFLHLDLKVFEVGPIVDTKIDVMSGANVKAKWEKDQYRLAIADSGNNGVDTEQARILQKEPSTGEYTRDVSDSDWIHVCLIEGDRGCVSGTENDIADEHATVGIHIKGSFLSWDFTIFDHDWKVYDDYRRVEGNKTFVQSLTFGDKLKYQLHCDHEYSRVPVRVMQGGSTVSGASVHSMTRFLHSDLRGIGTGITGTDGTTTLFLPEQGMKLAAHKKIGSSTHSGSAPANASEIRRHQEIVINLPDQSDETKTITVRKNWEIDMEDHDRPDEVMVVIEKWNRQTGKWEIYEDLDSGALAVGRLDAAHKWEWNCGNQLRKSEITPYGEMGIHYRVRELAEGTVYDEAEYRQADAACKEQIRNALREKIVYDELDYLDDQEISLDEANTVTYSVNAYTTRTGEFVPNHKTKYLTAYNMQFASEALSSVTSGAEDDEVWTITNTAVYDAKISKRFILPSGGSLPQNVFLVLTARPKAGWSNIAEQIGVSPTEQIVVDPYSGGMTLSELEEDGVVNTDTIPGFEDLDIAVGRACLPNDYTVYFTVDKYNKGIPLDFGCSELTSEHLRWMFLQIYRVDVTPAVYTDNEYQMIPGGAYPLLDNDTLLVGTVINAPKSGEIPMIGGTKYWVNTAESDLSQIEWIRLHIREETGEEISGSPITVYAKDNMRTNPDGTSEVMDSWVWCLVSDEIEPSKVYTVTEEAFPESYSGKDSWIPQMMGCDVINTWAGPETKIRIYKAFEPAVTTASGDKIAFTVKRSNGEAVYTTEHLFGSGETVRQVWEPASSVSYSWKEMMRSRLEEMTRVTEHTFIPTVSSPVPAIEDGNPVLVFAVTNRQQKYYTFEIEKKWNPNNSAPDGISSIDVRIYRNGAEYGNYSLSAPTWKHTVTGSHPFLDDRGIPYVYNLKEMTALSGFTSSWANGVIEADHKNRYTLVNRKLSADELVSLTIIKKWEEKDNRTSYRPDKVSFSIVGKDALNAFHYMGSKTISKDVAANEQTVVFDGLPRIDDYGGEYEYFVQEEHVPDYTTVYTPPVQDASTGNWSCTVTNTLTSGCEVIIQKDLTNEPSGADAKTFSFEVHSDDPNAPMPLEWMSTPLQIQGEGRLALHFPIESAGTYMYTISETGESSSDLWYDTTARKLIIEAAQGPDTTMTYKCYVKLVTPGNEQDADRSHYEQTNWLVFNNIYHNAKDITVEKIWDIDTEQKDKPDSIQVVLQSQGYNTVKGYYETPDNAVMEWKTEQVIELNSAGSWTGKFKGVPIYDVDANGNQSEIHYRVRELKEDDSGRYTEIPPTPYGAEYLASVSSRIVHDKKDSDKISIKALIDKGIRSAEQAFHFELADNPVYRFAREYVFTEEDQTVAYTVPEYQTLNGKTEPEHKTKYMVEYKMEGDKATITNTAVLDTNIYKRWINFEEGEKPDGVYLTLMGRVREEYREMVPPELKNLAGTYLPVFNPLTNGSSLLNLVGIHLPDGLDGAIPGMSLAIARATDDSNPLKAWHVGFRIKKYSMFGVPMEYEGAELSSGILKSLIKALTGLDFPISISLPGGYVSVPGKAICIPILDKDWELTSNVFNFKTHVGPDETPTPEPPGPPTPPVPSVVPSLTPPVPTVRPSLTPSSGPSTPTPTPKVTPTPTSSSEVTPTPTPKVTPTPTPTPERRRIVAGIKYWINDSADTRPETLKIHIYNGTEEIQGSPVTLRKSDFGESNAWPWAFMTTDKGPESSYTVAEEFPEDYEYWNKYHRISNGLTLLNYWIGDTTPIVRIRKVWKSEVPADTAANVSLREAGSREDLKTFELKADNRYQAEISLSDSSLKGLDISQLMVYEEDQMVGDRRFKPGYSGPVLSYEDGQPVYTFTVTNWPVENLRVIVEKEWIGDNEAVRPEKLGVSIIRTGADGKRERIPFDLTNDTWRRESTPDEEAGLPNLDDAGRQYRYDVEEETVSGYRTSIRFNRSGNILTYHLKNTWIPPEERVNVSGVKIWNDEENAFGVRPKSIRIVVMNSRLERVTEVMELSSDQAQWHVSGLPRYDEEGEELRYFVVEEQPEDYTVKYSVPVYEEQSRTWTCNVFNIFSARKQLTVEKKWFPETDLPSSLAVYLYAGDYLRGSVYLNRENQWKYVFKDLPVLDEEGNGIAYRVVEDVPDGYAASSYMDGEELDEHFYLENRKHEKGEVVIPVEKNMTGGLIPGDEDETFRFKITGLEYIGEDASTRIPMPAAGDEITIRNEGTGAFVIPFESEGLYLYSISEIPGNNANITYDQSEKKIVILAYREIVSDELLLSWGMIENGEVTEHEYVTFTNRSKQRLYTITYDPNGGVIEGGKVPVSRKYPYGSVITIHDAAERTEYKFDYWKGSRYNPGEQYTVVGDHLFVAQWISDYENPFTFTKVWDGKPGTELSYTVYNPDGTAADLRFPNPRKLDDHHWEYRRWFVEKPEYYVIENVPAGYYATYSNVGEHAEVTDRCYNGGTITNHQIPETGDEENRVLWSCLALLSCGIVLVVVVRGNRQKKRPDKGH